MATPIIQPSFAAGEIAPRLHGHVDLQKYRAGCKLARNFFVDYRGGLTSRPGTQLVGFPSGQSAKPRLIPFTLSTTQSYVLVLDSTNLIRFIYNGAFVTEAPINITAGSNANPLTLTIPGHTYIVGQDVFIAGVNGLARTNGVSGVNGRTLRVSNVVGNVVTFENMLTGTNVDAHTWTAYSSGGTASRIYQLAHPWAAADLFDLNFAQSIDEAGLVLTVTHPDYAIYQIRPLSPATPLWECVQQYIGTNLVAPLGLAITPLNNNVANPQFDTYYAITCLDTATNEESMAGVVVGTTNQALNQTTGVANQLIWYQSPNIKVYNVYATNPVPSGSAGPGPYTFGLIGQANSNYFVDNNYTRDFSISPPEGVNPFQYGTVSSAFVDAAGFGYIYPVWTIYDPTGAGAVVTMTVNSAGAVTSASVTLPGNADYSAPISVITEGDTTPGSGATAAFNGSLVSDGSGGYVPAANSLTVSGGTGYHVPYVTLSASQAFGSTFSGTDIGTDVVLSGNALTVSTGASNLTGNSYARTKDGQTSGKYYFEVKVYASGYHVAPGISLNTVTDPYSSAGSPASAFVYGDGVIYVGGAQQCTAAQSNIGIASNGKVYGIAVDFGAKKIWFTGDGVTWNSSINSSAPPNGGYDISGIFTAAMFATAGLTNQNANTQMATINCGASAFSYSVPSGFTAGWPGPYGALGNEGFYYLTTNSGVPSAFVTIFPMTLPSNVGILKYALTLTDTLPGAVIGASQARGHVTLANQNFPSVVAYFDQREVVAATKPDPDTFWMTKPGLYNNFDQSFPSQGNDAVTGTIVGQEVNAIVSLTPMASGLIALTSHGAWQISGGQPGAAITPDDITAQAQAFSGAAPLRPLRVNYDLIYLQARGSAVRDLTYNFFVNVYTGSDVSALSSHLLEGRTIVDWAYAEQPNYIIHCVRDDGMLLSFTYLKEQDLYGWAHWDTAGQYEAVATIPEGTQDAVYYAVNRYLPGLGIYAYAIERLASTYMGGNAAANIPSNPELAWCLDAAVQYPLTTPNATLSMTLRNNGEIGTPDIVLGGSGYTAPTAQIIDPTGAGATITLTTTGGAITGATFTPGKNYTNPQVVILDTTGKGAEIIVPVQNTWLANVSGGTFTFGSGNVGQVLRVQGGVGTVQSIVSAAQAVVSFPLALRPQAYPEAAMPYGTLPNAPGTTTLIAPQPSGSWSLTAPVSVVGGLDHATGSYVELLADGNVVPPQLVVDGCVTLPAPASSILAGFGYTCQFQPLRPDVGEPTVQGRRKAIPALTLRVLDERGIRVGPDFANLDDLKEREDWQPMGPCIPFDRGGGVIPPLLPNGPQSFYPLDGTRDKRKTISGGWTVDGYFCVQQDYPLPVSILATIPEIDLGDDPA